MLQLRRDTIVALATPAGRGALAVVRLSGPGAGAIAARLVAPWPPAERRATLVTLRDPRDGAVLDQALVTRFAGPRSFTGEDVVELACHGGLAVAPAVVAACLAAGAREAAPGEFTQRAVLHGKLDVLRAEAIGDLVDARTQALRRVAVHHLDGGLTRALAALRERLLHVEALLAYDIDFPEEDDGPVARGAVLAAARAARAGVAELLSTVSLGAMARDGATVVIAGAPNAGKSSLFNALVGEARAIVTDRPGTTRDALEAVVEWGAWPLRLVDTAGLRATDDEVERLGIEVSARHVRAAAVVLACGDTPAALAEACARVRALGEAPVLPVRTKADATPAGGAPWPADAVAVSAHARTGLDALLDAVAAALARGAGAVPPDVPVITRERHRAALAAAHDELAAFEAAWDAGALPAPVAAVHVRAATHALDELVGSVDVEDVLGRVFASFCVGK